MFFSFVLNCQLIHHNGRLLIKRGFSAFWTSPFLSARFFRLFSLRLLLFLGLAASRLCLLRGQNLLDVAESFPQISIRRLPRIS